MHIAMTVYTESQASRQLDDVLNQATAQGEVRIRRSDGREFLLKPLPVAAAVDPDASQERRRDLGDIAGTWVEDPAFDDVMRDQDRVDPDLWK